MVDIFTEKIYVWTGMCLFALFILSVVGLGSPAWRVGSYGTEQNVEAGLVTRCYHDMVTSQHRCSPFSLGSQTAWFEVSRVFCSISVVLLLTLVVASAFLHFVDGKRQDFHYIVIATIFTALMGGTGAVLFAARSSSMFSTFSGQLAWGWAVYLVSQILAALLIALLFYIVRAKRRRPRRRPVAPAREIIF